MPIGKHVLLDMEFEEYIDNDTLMSLTFQIAENAIHKKSTLKIMSRVMYPLKNPDGFSWYIGLDESHITCHCYNDTETCLKLLAFDAFTCGNNNPELIIDMIRGALLLTFNSMKINNTLKVDRFFSG